jgi:hypothetical protein
MGGIDAATRAGSCVTQTVQYVGFGPRRVMLSMTCPVGSCSCMPLLCRCDCRHGLSVSNVVQFFSVSNATGLSQADREAKIMG